MKKITTLLILASLALAGAVMAQEPTPADSQAPAKKEAPAKKPRAEKPAAEKPAPPHAPKTEAPAVAPKTDAPAVKEPSANEPPPPPKTDKKEKGPNRKPMPPVAPEKKDSAEQPATSATPDAKKEQPSKHNKDMKAPKDTKAPDANAKTAPSVAPTTATTPAAKTTPPTATTPATTPVTATTPATTPVTATTPAAAASTTPATAATASAAPSVSQTNSTTTTAAVKKPDQAKVQQIRQQHLNFRAQAKPDRVPAVTFSANFRLPGVEMWTGPQYEVYRSYRPERHDRGWYHQHYQRVELISGGYYYFNNGYWYPAWGYDQGNQYYAYDAPIYVGKRSDPPDKVIADVQAVLQDMGYYKGEVDGLIGPLTREALTGYQRDNGMTVTAVIDEPTLDALNMG